MKTFIWNEVPLCYPLILHYRYLPYLLIWVCDILENVQQIGRRLHLK